MPLDAGPLKCPKCGFRPPVGLVRCPLCKVGFVVEKRAPPPAPPRKDAEPGPEPPPQMIDEVKKHLARELFGSSDITHLDALDAGEG
jgi:hypothetical protein